VGHSRFVAYRGISPDIVPIAATTAAFCLMALIAFCESPSR
jgi:hypothetical protein